MPISSRIATVLASPSLRDNIICHGDDLTKGESGVITYPSYLKSLLGSNPRILNYGTDGKTITNLISDAPSIVDVKYGASAFSRNIVLIWGGTNDIAINSESGDAVWQEVYDYCAARKAEGWLVFVVTMLPRSDAGIYASFETERQEFLNLLRNEWPLVANGLVDPALDNRIGDDGDDEDTDYFNADKFNLIEAGNLIVAQAADQAIYDHHLAHPYIANLIAYLPLRENAGSTRDDHSGAYPFTVVGTVNRATGKVLYASDFTSGFGNYLDGGNATFQVTDTDDWWFSVWAKSGSTINQYNAILGRDYFDSSPFKREYFICRDPVTNKLRFLWCGELDGSPFEEVQSTVDLATNTWYFVNAWYDNTANKLRIKVNDETTQEITPTLTPAYSNDHPFCIGNNGSVSANMAWLGLIGDFYKYDRKPTEDELHWRYNYGRGRSFGEISKFTKRRDYFIGTFNTEPDAKLWIYHSEDGINFDNLFPAHVYDPATGLRDPAILRHSNGTFYCTYTQQNGTMEASDAIGLAYSTDLENWSFLTELPAIASAVHCWNGDLFFDNDGILHSYFAAATDSWPGPFTVYESHPTAADLSTWSTPVSIGDLGENVMNTTLAYISPYYYLFGETNDMDPPNNQYIHLWRSSSPTSGFTLHASDPMGVGEGHWENCSIIKTDFNGRGTRWRMYLDKYDPLDGIYYTDCWDDFVTWSTPARLGGQTWNFRHGMVFDGLDVLSTLLA